MTEIEYLEHILNACEGCPKLPYCQAECEIADSLIELDYFLDEMCWDEDDLIAAINYYSNH